MNTQDIQLSEHFKLSEMTISGTAIRRGIDNSAGAEHIEALRHLCRDVLEPLRRRFGVIHISSGYRCQQLNAAVGGVKNSQHMRGEAVDIHMSSVEQAHRWTDYAMEQQLPFDQMLIERRLSNGCCWLHISHIHQPGRRQNRQQVLQLDV